MRLIEALTHVLCRGGKVDPRTLRQNVQIYCPVCRKLHTLTLDEIIMLVGESDEDAKAD